MNLLRLDGQTSTLLLLDRGAGLPEIVHWGAALPPDLDADAIACLRDRPIPINAPDADVPAATLLPTTETAAIQAPAFWAHREGRDWTACFSISSIDRDAGRLTLHATDAVADIGLVIWLALAGDGDVLCMHTELRNDADAPLDLQFLASGVFLAPPRAETLRAFGGRWGLEFSEQRIALPAGVFAAENRRGRTSHARFPLLIAGTADLDEDRGEAWGVHLGWSGNFRITTERLVDGGVLLIAGMLLHPGEAILPPGAGIATPTAYAAWSSEGLAGLSRAFHDHVRRHVVRWPSGAMSPRPVTANTWEGIYFAHDEQRLMRAAEAAAALGCERFVLDDGWMRGRDSDRRGLGDWVADPHKYPRGLAPLAEHVTALGMQFGLWVEPEMANPDSDFLRARPDAVLQAAGRAVPTARHQLVLDLGRADVFDAVHAALETLLSSLPIAYLKWDMNRDLVMAADPQGRPAYRRHVLAVYALIDRLRADHPALEIETCASGGARADLGMLTRTQRVWTSDCTDPLDRLSIQRGAGRLLPPELLGCHVSNSPNHQTGRRHTLTFRAAIALFGHFGIELDPLLLTADEAAELRQWIALHKRLRPLLHGGRHVASPALDGRSVSGVVAPDALHGVFLVVQSATPERALPAPLCLPGLDPAGVYRVAAPPPQRLPEWPSAMHRALFGEGVRIGGTALGRIGFVPPLGAPQSAIVLEAIREVACPT